MVKRGPGQTASPPAVVGADEVGVGLVLGFLLMLINTDVLLPALPDEVQRRHLVDHRVRQGRHRPGVALLVEEVIHEVARLAGAQGRLGVR